MDLEALTVLIAPMACSELRVQLQMTDGRLVRSRRVAWHAADLSGARAAQERGLIRHATGSIAMQAHSDAWRTWDQCPSNHVLHTWA